MNGIIQTSTGYLLRFGYCDFTAGTDETVVTNVPQDAEVLKENAPYISKWNGTTWEQITYADTLSLAQYKREKCNAIDAKTGSLIGNGFSYAGKVFSLSNNAQTNILALFTTRGHAALSYPIGYSTIDDADSYNVANATDVENMYLTALGTKRVHLDSGNALKAQVRASATKAAVDAITDNR